jgi:UDP-glucuronate decarboxylase
VAAVIGGAGLIGSRLCEALLAQGRRVVCIDDFSRGSVGNLTGFVGQPLGMVVSHDATRRLPDGLPRFDEIYHLAWPALSRPPSPAGEGKTARMAASILGRAAQDGASVLLALRCGAQPGRGAGGEPSDGAGGPTGRSRGRPVETLFLRWAARRGVPLRIARVVETRGPRVGPEAAPDMAQAVADALRGEVLGSEVLGGGGRDHARMAAFVDEVVCGCLRLMETGGDAAGPVEIVAPLAASPRLMPEAGRRRAL